MTDDLAAFIQSITIEANYPSKLQGRVRIASPENPDSCWEFTGLLNEDGYGIIVERGKKIRVHRYVWDFVFGDLCPTDKLLHSCDNPPCCRISHLSKGSQADNIRDMDAKGRRGTTKGRSKLSHDEQDAVYRMVNEDGYTIEEVSELFGISISQAWRVARDE